MSDRPPNVEGLPDSAARLILSQHATIERLRAALDEATEVASLLAVDAEALCNESVWPNGNTRRLIELANKLEVPGHE